MIGWVAFGFALVSLALWFTLAIVAVLLWGKARPIVQTYGPMISAMMPAAAGTGEIDKPIGSSPAAASPDRCEYEDHEWFPLDSPTMHGYDGPAHYCARCGFTERVPGS